VPRSQLGQLLEALGDKSRRSLRKIEETPLPLRDLIARVYAVEMLSGTKGQR
jgi:hypothetical protein